MPGAEPRSPAAGVFGFLLGLALLATAGATAVFALALMRGGGAIAGRWLLLLAVAALGGAVIAASAGPIDSSRRVSVGIALSGVVTALAFGVRAVLELDAVGPVDLGGIGAGIIVALAAPWLASLVQRWQLPDRFAALWPSADVATALEGGISWQEWALVTVGILGLIVALAYVLPSGTLGHDESVYAVKARSWIDGSPSTGFRVYRPVGMPIVGWVVLQLAESEVALRVAAAIIAVGVVLTMWAVGRRMLGAGAAMIGTATFMVSESYLRRATEFLNDLAAAGLLLAAVFFVWLHFERQPDGWWLLAAAPAAAGAYYMRYGSLFGLVVIVVVAAAIWFRRLGASWKPIAATTALFLGLLVPHFWYSQRLTGSMLGVLQAAREHAAGVGGFGIDDYIRFFPTRLAGTFGAMVMVAGVLYTVMLVLAARKDAALGRVGRTAGFLTVLAVATTLLLGAFTHGEPRFVFLPLMVLLLVGGQAVMMLLERLPPRTRWVTIGGFTLILAYALASGAGQMHNRLDRITTSRDVIAESGAVIQLDAAPGSCTVNSLHIPQVTWYSACATYSFNTDAPVADSAYLVLFANSDRNPSATDVAEKVGDIGGVGLIAIVPDDGGVYGDGLISEILPISGS